MSDEANTHAELSPSSASRWMNCPGSVALCRLAPPDTGSGYADEGTAAHWWAEQILSSAAGNLVGTKAPNGVLLTDEMLVDVMKYVKHVRALVESTGGVLLIEQRLPISDITGEPDAHGTSDVIILTDDELIVIDLKFGMGEKVDA